jgi:hypothetical protein
MLSRKKSAKRVYVIAGKTFAPEREEELPEASLLG